MAKKNDFAYARWADRFTNPTFEFYCNGKKDMESEKFLSAIVWSAVFIESLLKDVLRELNIECENAMLNALIEKVKDCMKQQGPINAADKKRFTEILDKCDSIRKSRNGLLHDSGKSRAYLELEAKCIYDLYLNKLLDEYVETAVAESIEQKKLKDTGRDRPVAPNFPVFVSTITPYTFEQAVFIESFCTRLKEIGVKPVRCGEEDFGTKDPMAVVRKMMEQCNAVVVLGLEKYHVYHYVEKKGSANPKEYINKSFSSEWLQIESGIAVGLGKKLFALHQKGLHSQGIFDHEWNSIKPIELDSGLDAMSGKVKTLLREIKEYMETCKK